MSARLSAHAIQRAREMAIPLARVTAVLDAPSLTYQSRDARIAWAASDPAFAVVYVEQPGGDTFALTVVPRTYERYRRRA